jgi:hypothetical protein
VRLAGVIVGSAFKPALSSSIVVTSMVQFWKDFELNSDRAGVPDTRDSNAADSIAEMESVLSMCQTASEM